MKNNDVIASLIKEIVKSEVKQQVKQEIIRLMKSGVLTMNSQKAPVIKENTQRKSTIQHTTQTTPTAQRPAKVYSKNLMINELLNNTKPFTNSERAEGATGNETSVLDTIKQTPSIKADMEEWPTISKTTADMNSMAYNTNQVEDLNIDTTTSTGQQQAAIVKALTRNYRDLVKRF